MAWVPALDGWLVTRRDLCVQVMRDADTYTVDDPRFSTAQVVGPSMLSLDGDDHRRHRDPFASAFRLPEVRERFTNGSRAKHKGSSLRWRRRGRPRSVGISPVRWRSRSSWRPSTFSMSIRPRSSAGTTRSWRPSTGYRREMKSGSRVAKRSNPWRATWPGPSSKGEGALAQATATLTSAEVVSNAAVMMFGGIETSEGMTTTLFWHLLTHPDQMAELREDRSLAAAAVDESLRLEPAAGRVDRYATRDAELAGVTIHEGDLVIVSLSAANRDPTSFPDPDQFDLARPNSRSHLAFAQGPHACVGNPPRQAGDAGRPRGGAGRLARPHPGRWQHRADGPHLQKTKIGARAMAGRYRRGPQSPSGRLNRLGDS